MLINRFVENGSKEDQAGHRASTQEVICNNQGENYLIKKKLFIQQTLVMLHSMPSTELEFTNKTKKDR